VRDISGTKVHNFLKLAVSEQSPQIYQPRQGEIKGSMNLYNRVQLEFLGQYSFKFLKMLSYHQTYLDKGLDLGDLETLEPLNGIKIDDKFI
jgi:hypothetical protein